MEYIRYEYLIKDSEGRKITGSFTLKSTANKDIVKELKAVEVERFRY